MPTLNIDYVGATKHHNNYRDLIPLEEQLPTILAPDNEYLVEAEDKVTGYYAYPFGQDEPEEILAEGNVIVDTPAPTTEYNADEAPRYTDPDNVAIATIRFEIDNQSEEEIGLGDISSKLTVNDGSQYLLNEGMLLPYDNSDTVAPGEEGELLQTFLLDKEMYEKFEG